MDAGPGRTFLSALTDRDLACTAQPADARLEREERTKHSHDLCGTFVRHLCRFGLTDQAIGGIVAWSVENVASVRRVYVDGAVVVVALSQPIRRALQDSL